MKKPELYVFIAVNDVQYVEMAVNLAISLRANGETLPFRLITNLSSEVDRQGMFQEIVRIEDRQNPFHLKTRLNEFATDAIYLDVDSICLGNPMNWAGRQQAPFQTHIKFFATPGRIRSENHYWCNPVKIYEKHKISESHRWPEINSSYLYVSDQVPEIWKLAEHFYSVDFYPEYQHEGFFNYPDELALETALALTGYYEANQGAQPLYFHPQSEAWNYRTIQKISAEMPIFTLNGAGKTTHLKLWEYYNRQGMKMARSIGKHWNRLNMDSKTAFKARGAKRYTGIRKETEGIETLLRQYEKH